MAAAGVEPQGPPDIKEFPVHETIAGLGPTARGRASHEALPRRRATMRGMSSLPEIEPRFGVDGHSFEECEHIVHDHDPDTALCGVDQTDVPWNQGFPPCQACMAVAQGRMS